MIFTGQSSLSRFFAGTLLLAVFSASPGFARDDLSDRNPGDQAGAPSPTASVATLAAQVGEIAHSTSISRAKKEKRISTAVRIAVVAATAYKTDRGEILALVLSHAEAAARVAPHLAEVIANAAAFAPPVMRIDTAPGQIRAAAFAAAKNPRAVPAASLAARGFSPTAHRRKPPEEIAAIEYPPAPSRSEPELEAETAETATVSLPPAESSAGKTSLGSNTNVNFTANLSTRHDDNVFLTSRDEVSDTIFSLTPGMAFQFGNASLAHGSLAYKETFLQYAHKSADNQALGSGSADFNYNDSGLAVNGNAAYQELNQNNREVAALGQKTIVRSNVLDITTGAESHLTAKTSVKGGLDLHWLKYENTALVGSREWSVPLKIYYETTPKVAVSTGFTYQSVQPLPDGPSGRDLFYNVGARGNFTDKLSGEISAGRHSRKTGDTPRQNLWGFDGNLSYDISPKTSSSLMLSRHFSTGVKGETLTNSSYTFKVSNDPSPQWQLSAGTTYRAVQYEPAVINTGGGPVTLDRQDRNWEGNFDATFVFSYSLSLSAGYTYRRNLSNLPGAEFGNNILSLMLDWRR
ncbi:MAG: putative beta-barrel porin 2 [Verrucomicrobia bacterium]|nr:MAG: putative beta-barrel porin 2 [Verrucomicrobiota bacterium]